MVMVVVLVPIFLALSLMLIVVTRRWKKGCAEEPPCPFIHHPSLTLRVRWSLEIPRIVPGHFLTRHLHTTTVESTIPFVLHLLRNQRLRGWRGECSQTSLAPKATGNGPAPPPQRQSLEVGGNDEEGSGIVEVDVCFEGRVDQDPYRRVGCLCFHLFRMPQAVPVPVPG